MYLKKIILEENLFYKAINIKLGKICNFNYKGLQPTNVYEN